MYKKITHYIVEEHFDGSNAIVDKMFAQGCSNTSNISNTGNTGNTMHSFSSASPGMARVYNNLNIQKAIEQALSMDNAIKLRFKSRQVWHEHFWYAKELISAIISGLPITTSSIHLENATLKISEIIGKYYSKMKGEEFNTLLSDLNATIGTLTTLAKKGSSLTDAKLQADQKISAIANFLDSLNPINWPKEAVKEVLTTYVYLLIDYVDAKISGNTETESKTKDEIIALLNSLAETFSAGIIEQFPELFFSY
jgi:hypothetical protein